MQKSRRRNSCRGFSLMELLIVIAIILIILTIAVPKFNKQMMHTHEMAAIRETQTILQAETQYYSTYGRFAQNLIELGPPASGADSQASANLIPKSLADGKHSGYLYTLAGTPTGYNITAVPETFGGSGGRTFFADQTFVIRNNFTAEPATANSPEIR